MGRDCRAGRAERARAATFSRTRTQRNPARLPSVQTVSAQLGTVLSARVLAEFGDAPQRYASAKARKNYAGTSPVTRQSGKKKIVLARHVHNDRLVVALNGQAFARAHRLTRRPRLL